MATIIEGSFDEMLGRLPDWEAFHESSEPEVFVTAAGFEDRALELFKDWIGSVSGIPEAIVIVYRTNTADNHPHLQELRELLANRGGRVEEIEYDQRTITAKVSKAFGRFSQTRRVLVDISAMASFVLYPILRAAFDSIPDNYLSVAYTEAQTYFPEKAEWDSFWKTLSDRDIVERAELFETHYFQSRGAERIYEALNFVGRNPSSLPGKLIMVPNFSFHRIFNMREYAIETMHVERNDVQWIVGRPPEEAVNGWRAEAVYKLCSQPKHCEYCSTLNYKDILAKLQGIWEENYATRSLVIATLGSKAQHLGTFLFLVMHPEVSLLLSEPEAFVAERFSSGVGEKHRLECGLIKDMCKHLGTWNHLRFVW